jgi:hypothetical protein
MVLSELLFDVAIGFHIPKQPNVLSLPVIVRLMDIVSDRGDDWHV